MLVCMYWPNLSKNDAGVVTSPGFPEKYPKNLAKTETILVEEKLLISLQFAVFDIRSGNKENSQCDDTLSITDGNGTPLMNKSCKISLPNAVISTSNIVNILFSTDGYGAASGWKLGWSEVTRGKLKII